MMAEQSEYCLRLLSSGQKIAFPLSPSDTIPAEKSEHHLLLPGRGQKVTSLSGQGDGACFHELGVCGGGKINSPLSTLNLQEIGGWRRFLLEFGWNNTGTTKIVRTFFRSPLARGNRIWLELILPVLPFWGGDFSSTSFGR